MRLALTLHFLSLNALLGLASPLNGAPGVSPRQGDCFSCYSAPDQCYARCLKCVYNGKKCIIHKAIGDTPQGHNFVGISKKAVASSNRQRADFSTADEIVRVRGNRGKSWQRSRTNVLAALMGSLE
ncbi:hypothetical protein QBC34DRAFT_427359 [Podospora aff. communis PSN243]|uniref:Uncharacterized protein n=1 Tax=Podospora aff. communis PSN243 TaxID=3040156 RepID=A0AAV9GGN1_9PEZI|nr:hypothetical protein QBC34DRAFT_427359 [Podospora aff. communis PSN243]